MNSTLEPYSYVKSHDPNELRFKTGFTVSLVVHFALLIFIFVRAVFFPSEQNAYVPVLRVDLVGLPELTKSELPFVPPPQEKEAQPKMEAEPLPTTEEPEEMALETKKKKKEKVERKDKIKSALHRIQALEKILNQEEADSKPSIKIKGNKVSPGLSTTGDARESDTPNYADIVRERLRLHWELPVYLQRQNLSAKVLINIDSRGRIIGMKFIKASGDSKFDEAVRKAVTDADPLPPPPEKTRDQVLASGIIYGFPL